MFWISVVSQYERAVVFRLGRYLATRGPGLVFMIPFVDRGERVDMRELVLDEPPQSSITKDNALVDVDFVVYMQIIDPAAAIINVQNFLAAVRNLATTTLRSVIGDITVEEVLSKRDEINERLKLNLATVTIRWGVQVNNIEIREITPQADIQQAMTRLLTADRTKRALAEGSKEAAILEAQGVRESSILRAEGQRQATILGAEGFAIGLERVYASARQLDANTMGLQYLEMLKQLGQGSATKWIIPVDLANLAGPLGSVLTNVGRPSAPPNASTNGGSAPSPPSSDGN
jgi:regulator of protease activity HflC (stomatin/prohibitin superfamily)